MRRTVLLAALATALPAAAFAGPASDAVKFFYVPAVKFEADAQYRDRFVEPVTKLFDLNDQATKKNPDQVACIDFDPGLDAQDFDQKTVSKTLKLSETVDGDAAQVVASFKLFSDGDDSQREMRWSLKQVRRQMEGIGHCFEDQRLDAEPARMHGGPRSGVMP